MSPLTPKLQVFCACPPSLEIHPVVLALLKEQGIEVEFHRFGVEPVFPVSQRTADINRSHEALQEKYAHSLSDDTPVLLLDSDVIVPPNTLVPLFLYWQGSGVASLAMRTKGCDSDHVICACVLTTAGLWKKVDYASDKLICPCRKLAAVGRLEYHPQISGGEV